MPLSLKQYGVNLYSMNALGEQWMDQTVTASTFRGPPIVLVNSVINDPLRPDVIAVADFADYWNVPLIGFDTTVVASSWATAILRNACLAATKFFTMPRIGPFPPLTTATLTASLAFTGPWISIETLGNGTSIDAWNTLAYLSFTRTYQNHPYRCGMQGVSQYVITNYGVIGAPPLYAIASDGNVVGALSRLRKKWDGDAIPSVSQFEALMVADGVRLGLGRLCNPALIPELVLMAPL